MTTPKSGNAVFPPSTPLQHRLAMAAMELDPVHSDYCVIFEADIDNAAALMVPDANWMACALHGGILPPIDSFHQLECLCTYHRMDGDQIVEARSVRMKLCEFFPFNKELNKEPVVGHWELASQKILNSEILHEAAPIGPMSEQAAIEYLIQKDVPPEVWSASGANCQKFKIVPKTALPSRKYRESWSLNT